MKSIREILAEKGIVLESRYMIYRSDRSLYVVPYAHIRTVEKRANTVILYTGGIERISISFEDEKETDMFLEELLIYIERVYLR